MMINHYAFTDEELVRNLEDGTFPPALFTHEAHLRLAYVLLSELDLNTAINRVCIILKRYVAAVGAGDKYDELLTIAAIRIVYRLMRKEPAATFSEFLGQNPELRTNFRSLIEGYYNSGW